MVKLATVSAGSNIPIAALHAAKSLITRSLIGHVASVMKAVLR
jgi:hypothetical protein